MGGGRPVRSFAHLWAKEVRQEEVVKVAWRSHLDGERTGPRQGGGPGLVAKNISKHKSRRNAITAKNWIIIYQAIKEKYS